MKIPNPTRVQIGDTASFAGLTYGVKGRAVLGVMEGGRPWFWHEFNLESDDGRAVDLVFEGGAICARWRLFTLVEPSPISAFEAGVIGAGDRVNLQGPFVVTRKDVSRVYYTEGKTPEGVCPGARATYLNARDGNKLAVVSWTGDEVEFYRGRNVPARTVASALGLRGWRWLIFFALNGTRGAWPVFARLIIPGFCLGFVLLISTSIARSRRAPPLTRAAPPPSTLKAGDTGVINGTRYHVAGQTTMDVAEVGRLAGSREYILRDDEANPALLVELSQAEPVFYTEIKPEEPLRPTEAAALRTGQKLELGGQTVTVGRLGRYTVVQSEGGDPLKPSPGEVLYGFTGVAGTNSVLVRWNNHGIQFYQGARLASKTRQEMTRPR